MSPETERITKAECSLCRESLILRLTAAAELSEAKMVALNNQIESVKTLIKVVGVTITTVVAIVQLAINYLHL